MPAACQLEQQAGEKFAFPYITRTRDFPQCFDSTKSTGCVRTSENAQAESRSIQEQSFNSIVQRENLSLFICLPKSTENKNHNHMWDVITCGMLSGDTWRHVATPATTPQLRSGLQEEFAMIPQELVDNFTQSSGKELSPGKDTWSITNENCTYAIGHAPDENLQCACVPNLAAAYFNDTSTEVSPTLFGVYKHDVVSLPSVRINVRPTPRKIITGSSLDEDLTVNKALPKTDHRRRQIRSASPQPANCRLCARRNSPAGGSRDSLRHRALIRRPPQRRHYTKPDPVKACGMSAIAAGIWTSMSPVMAFPALHGQTECLITPSKVEPGHERDCNNTLRIASCINPLHRPVIGAEYVKQRAYIRQRHPGRGIFPHQAIANKRTWRWVRPAVDNSLPETACGTMSKSRVIRELAKIVTGPEVCVLLTEAHSWLSGLRHPNSSRVRLRFPAGTMVTENFPVDWLLRISLQASLSVLMPTEYKRQKTGAARGTRAEDNLKEAIARLQAG
ncbi:hypothetical protein PR048_024030 [Dryococelus australis]|uniref:Uncharacterized protein n=1 Tax=Dryococelus australis TaxID=614101 RepID=A0ABQ9GVQ7_9NEOP|nr:hypothetical protein PR048_024030 [Dryococelus australis]